jgi:peptidoglycan/LPS O-acetylase OafA/YrhL
MLAAPQAQTAVRPHCHPPSRSLGYHPGLDGLRAFSILLVLLDHGLVLRRGYGFLGVNTFFVLSGFLITSLLKQEWEQTGSISLRDFYLRRALRLLPALLTMIGAFAVYLLFTAEGSRLVDGSWQAVCAIFYCTNWAMILNPHFGHTLPLNHTWSLAVEEQFYTVWPLLLLLLLKRTSRSSTINWLLFGIIMSVCVRIFLLVGDPDVSRSSPEHLTFGTDARADSLLVGCLAAILMLSPRGASVSGKPFLCPAIAGLAGILMLGQLPIMSPGMVFSGWLLASIFAGMVIVHVVASPPSMVHRLLENRALVFIGKISYGLYLWHYPVLLALQEHNLPWQHLAYLVPTVPLVLLSYHFIEKPCLRIKHRFQNAA